MSPRERREARITVEPCVTLGSDHLAQLWAEAERIGEILETPVSLQVDKEVRRPHL